MSESNLLQSLLPDLTPEQVEALERLPELYGEWNAKINLISRKDIDNIMPHHILHSLCIARVFRFAPGATVLDFGTGGGFPGIPLAIVFPEVQFHLIDSIGKKIRVVQDITERLGLKNVTTDQVRGEQLTARYTYVVSRAVTSTRQLWQWVRPLLLPRENVTPPNGLIMLKGGPIEHEIATFGQRAQVWPLQELLPDPYFEDKHLILIQALSK